MQKNFLYPLQFHPLVKTRVWGGKRLNQLLQRPLSVEGPIGESWELVDLPTDQSIVSHGPLKNYSLSQIIREQTTLVLGPVSLDGNSFPALVKFIDAAERLSIQVHPNRQVAAKLGGRAKSEAWYILDAEPNAILYLGLVPGVTKAGFQEALVAGQMEDILLKLPVKKGDLVPVFPGTVHAIGEGILLTEVQQPSDTTYRVYDWGRVGLDGSPRELHLPQALESIQFATDAIPSTRLSADEVDLGVFKLQVKAISPGQNLYLENAGPLVIIGLEGESVLSWSDWPSMTFSRGDVTLVPHVCKPVALQTNSSAKVLVTCFT